MGAGVGTAPQMLTAGMLEGVRIVDLTSIVFGPYCTQLMAEMGADVIKVEAPAGDLLRRAGTPAVTPGMGPNHMTLNRGKRSAALDLKTPRDAETMRGLLAGADVFIHNVRGRPLAALGFDYEAVRAIKPDIIYVHCVGFGSDGPYAGLQAYDDVIQAASGMTTLQSRADGNPVPRYVPSLIADKVAGLYAAQAVLVAMVHRLRTGAGQFVEVPMFECFTQFLYEEHLFDAVFDPPTGPAGYPRQFDPERQPFRTADGYIAIVPYTDASWLATFTILGRPDILDTPDFATPALRQAHVTRLYGAIGELTPAGTTGEWLSRLSAAQVPAMAVRDIADIQADPHLMACGFFAREAHPTEGACLAMRPPVRFSARPAGRLRPAPLLGEHTEALRAGWTDGTPPAANAA